MLKFIFLHVIAVITFFFAFANKVSAQSERNYRVCPRWVGDVPRIDDGSCSLYVTFVDLASDLESARVASKKELYSLVEKKENIEVVEDYNYKSIQDGTDMNISERSNDIYKIKIRSSGKVLNLPYKKLDEYWVKSRNGNSVTFKLYTLYVVSHNGETDAFQNIHLTERYGVKPVFMSLIPGGGQIYKGSYVKGGSLFASEVLSVVGIVLCENQRADYTNKAKEQPRFAKEYSTKARNWETGRNICIGVAGAIYLYNLVDAAVSKGARRIKIKPAGSPNFAFNPCLLQDINSSLGAGVRFTYNF